MRKTIVLLSLASILPFFAACQGQTQSTTTPDQMTKTEASPFQEQTQQQRNTGSTENQAQPAGQYIDYSPAAFAAAQGKKRVYFFYAKWCPTCKAANQDLTVNGSMIPADVVLFKTDYDTETELKKKFAITYQHTFVLVDDSGEEIKKWNGGGVEELIAQTQ